MSPFEWIFNFCSFLHCNSHCELIVQGGTGGQRKEKKLFFGIFLFSIPNNNNGPSSGLIFFYFWILGLVYCYIVQKQ